MFQEFLIPFIAVFLAELGDKTQIAIFCLASKTQKYYSLLGGVMLGFILADGLAILLGNYVTNLIPLSYIKIISGIIFIIFGILTLLNQKEEDSACALTNPFFSGFTIILFSEMGDKTQISSGLFATQYNLVIVFFGVIAALTLSSVIAVFLGKVVLKKINRKTVSTIAGILFIIIGIFCFF